MSRIAFVSVLSSVLMAGTLSAQEEGPLVTSPSAMATSDSFTEIAMRGLANAYEAEADVEAAEVQREPGVLKRPGLELELPALLAPSPNVPVPAPVQQTANPRPSLGATVIQNCEGLGLGTPGYTITGAPPDTVLGVSPTQIVQWVNSHIAVYDKSCNPLLPAPGFIRGNKIWETLPAGSLCRDFNRGDPMVQYDRYADRWILGQFAFNASFTSNAYCIAVSTTSNATGTYSLYEYSFGDGLPDYPKLGVWWDAYYVTFNMFTTGSSFGGGRACAYDRAAMIAGAAASSICFNSLDRFSFMPADAEGSLPPAPGTPNFHISWNWAFLAAPPYTMQLTKFVPDFVTPASSTFGDGQGGGSFSFVPFPLDGGTIASCGDTSGACLPQPGTTQRLDTLSDRHMFRLAYRNFGTFDSLVVTQTVDPAGAQLGGVRWWEIRNPNANAPIVYQNSTYAPADGLNRWMSSGATDKRGNFAIGYSAGSAAVPAGIRIAGRLRTEPRNILRGEQTLMAGAGSQLTSLARWGDYSAMQIDPADDCTFWYTTEYLAANGTFNWHTRMAGFKFPNCQ